MPNIRLISSTIVGPICHSHDHHDDRLELIPCDLTHLVFVPMQGGLIFDKRPKPDCEKDILSQDLGLVDHLKAALSETLGIFYPLAGRLAVVENDRDGTAVFSIDCSGGGDGNGGALFVHVATDGIAVGDILNQLNVPKDLIRSFFPMNGVLNYQAVSEPFLAAQVTELVDGIFVACTMSHLAADGTTFWHFFNTWSHISRRRVQPGEASTPPPPPPVFDRHCFSAMFDLPIRIPFSYEKITRLSLLRKTLPTQIRFFNFSKTKIAQLKAAANAEAGANTGGTFMISSLQALMAHLWVSITRSRGLRGDEEVTHWIVVGLRQRMQPPLPNEYFGNAVRTVAVKSTAGELLNHGGFGLAARLINEAIASQTPTEVRAHLEEWAKRPVLVGSTELPKNLVMTGGSPRYDLFGNDFGWGPPVAVRSGKILLEGRLVPFPGAEQGSIDFEVCLLPEAMHALAQDTDFAGNSASKY